MGTGRKYEVQSTKEDGVRNDFGELSRVAEQKIRAGSASERSRLTNHGLRITNHAKAQWPNKAKSRPTEARLLNSRLSNDDSRANGVENVGVNTQLFDEFGGQADDVGIAALEAFDVGVAAVLDAVGAGFALP